MPALICVIAMALVLSSALPVSAAALEEKLAACLACHGTTGQAVIPEVPSLGGQPVFYLTIQLLMFRDKLRIVEPMNQAMQGLTDDDLRNLAVGRLFCDNIPHIKTHWIMVTPFLSQTALSFGVNDLEGTVVREKIYHEAGAHTAQAMSLNDILKLIRGAGKIPAERDSFYNIIRTFDGDEPSEKQAA